MPAVIDILDPFNRIQPGVFISRYSDWIIFTLLLFFFWAVVGIALRKKFEESRHLRVLVTAVSLMLAVGTYYAIYQGWLHLSLQGLGLFGAILLFIVVFFILLGLMRGYGMHFSNALPISFVLFYISLWAVSPNILHNLAEIFPPANGILLILFVVSVFKVFFAFFRYSKEPSFTHFGKDSYSHIPPASAHKIDQELSEEGVVRKMLRKKTVKLTKTEIKTIRHMEEYLKQLVEICKESPHRLSQEQIQEISTVLRTIGKEESILKKGLISLNSQLEYYKAVENKDIGELKKRLAETTDKKQTKIIQDEIFFHTKMLEAERFIQQNESMLLQFIQTFNTLLGQAAHKLEIAYPQEARPFVEEAYKRLSGMKNLYEKLESIEKAIFQFNKSIQAKIKDEKKR